MHPFMSSLLALLALGASPADSLRQFDEAHAAFSTAYPADLRVEQLASDEGVGYGFVEKAGDTAQIYFRFFAYGPTSVALARETIVGERALFDTNGWSVRSHSAEIARRYSWAVEQWQFSATKDDERGMLGDVVLGKGRHGAFYVISIYPAADAERWRARQRVIFDHAKFR